MVFCAILGVVVERVAYKPLRKATRVAALITAIGVSFLLQYIVLFIMGPEVKAFPETLQNKSYSLGGITIDEQQITIFVVTIVLMLALQFIVKKPKWGKQCVLLVLMQMLQN